MLHFSSILHQVNSNFFGLLPQLSFHFTSVLHHILSSIRFFPVQEVVLIPIKNQAVFWFKFFNCDTWLSFRSICLCNLLKVVRKFQVDCFHLWSLPRTDRELSTRKVTWKLSDSKIQRQSKIISRKIMCNLMFLTCRSHTHRISFRTWKNTSFILLSL